MFPAKLALKLMFNVNVKTFPAPDADDPAPKTVHWPLLVEPDDTRGLSDAIRRLSDPATRASMGNEAAQIGATHGEPQNFTSVLRVFETA